MKIFKLSAGQLAASFFLVTTSAAAWSQGDLRDTLFADADDALKAANEARASVLAPRSYGEASEAYRSAEDKLQRSRSIDSIKDDLADAAQAFRQSVESTKLARVTLTTAIQARDDAEAELPML